MSHANPNPLPEGTRYGVGGVDPAVSIQNILRDVLGVDAVYGVANVLTSRDDEGKGEENNNSYCVVKSENCCVDLNVGHFDKGFQTSEYVDHCSTVRCISQNIGHFFLFLWCEFQDVMHVAAL